MECVAECSESYGSPLAVCVNDCEIDYGQPPSELAPICFRVGCAFAPMRWGPQAAASDPDKDLLPGKRSGIKEKN